MSSPLLLNGHSEFRDETPALRREIERLVSELRRTEGELKQAQNEALAARQAVANLRRLLAPLWGEVQALADDSPSFAAPQDNSKWESWKRKLGGKAAEFITELLIHGEMSGQQLKVATRCGQQTVYDTIAKLNKAQLLDKNGGKYRLKEI